jgi:uncharacterized membrane protein
MILRLFALRPLLSMALFGIPILTLVAVGLVTIFALKALLFLVIPVALVFLAIWVYRRLMRANEEAAAG